MTFEQQVAEAIEQAVMESPFQRGDAAGQIGEFLARRVSAAIEAVAMLHVRSVEGEGYGAGYVLPDSQELALRVLRGQRPDTCRHGLLPDQKCHSCDAGIA